MSGNSILLVGSSIGFRSQKTRGINSFSIRSQTYEDGKIPWILDYYSENCLRFYKTGFTILDFLAYLEKYNVTLPKFDYVIVNFGIVEGWVRNQFDGYANGEADWNGHVSRLLKLAENTTYYDDFNTYVNKVKTQNLDKTILSAELFRQYLVDFFSKINFDEAIVVVMDEKHYKEYTQKSIGVFNQKIKQVCEEMGLELIKFKNLDLYDDVHLTFNSHKLVADLIKERIYFKPFKISRMYKLYTTIKEYCRFIRYDKNDIFGSSIKNYFKSKMKRFFL